MAFTCPTCGTPVTGTVQAFVKHTGACGKATKAVKAPGVLPCGQSLPTLPLPMRFELSLVWPSQNQAHGSHWREYHKLRTAWRTAVGFSLRELQGRKFAWSSWRFTRLIPKRGKYYDVANIVGGGKPVIDALSYWNIIHDDAPDYFEGIYDQCRVTDDSGIRTIFELIAVEDHPRNITNAGSKTDAI